MSDIELDGGDKFSPDDDDVFPLDELPDLPLDEVLSRMTNAGSNHRCLSDPTQADDDVYKLPSGVLDLNSLMAVSPSVAARVLGVLSGKPEAPIDVVESGAWLKCLPAYIWRWLQIRRPHLLDRGTRAGGAGLCFRFLSLREGLAVIDSTAVVDMASLFGLRLEDRYLSPPRLEHLSELQSLSVRVAMSSSQAHVTDAAAALSSRPRARALDSLFIGAACPLRLSYVLESGLLSHPSIASSLRSLRLFIGSSGWGAADLDASLVPAVGLFSRLESFRLDSVHWQLDLNKVLDCLPSSLSSLHIEDRAPSLRDRPWSDSLTDFTSGQGLSSLVQLGLPSSLQTLKCLRGGGSPDHAQHVRDLAASCPNLTRLCLWDPGSSPLIVSALFSFSMTEIHSPPAPLAPLAPSLFLEPLVSLRALHLHRDGPIGPMRNTDLTALHPVLLPPNLESFCIEGTFQQNEGPGEAVQQLLAMPLPRGLRRLEIRLHPHLTGPVLMARSGGIGLGAAGMEAWSSWLHPVAGSLRELVVEVTCEYEATPQWALELLIGSVRTVINKSEWPRLRRLVLRVRSRTADRVIVHRSRTLDLGRGLLQKAASKSQDACAGVPDGSSPLQPTSDAGASGAEEAVRSWVGALQDSWGGFVRSIQVRGRF